MRAALGSSSFGVVFCPCCVTALGSSISAACLVARVLLGLRSLFLLRAFFVALSHAWHVHSWVPCASFDVEWSESRVACSDLTFRGPLHAIGSEGHAITAR